MTTEVAAGYCAQEKAPDLAVIVGALTARTLKPTDAREQMDRQVEAVRARVSERGGQLQLGETIRAARSGAPEANSASDRPFVRVQRLEAAFATDAPIDDILEELLRLGLDRYGRELVLDGTDGRSHVVVRYRFRGLRQTLEALESACQADAWERWQRAIRPAGGRDVERTGCRLRKLTFVVRSQPVLAEHGSAVPLELAEPWDTSRLDELELLGQVPLRLHGTLTAIVEGCAQP
jgi:hypothetical protein